MREVLLILLAAGLVVAVCAAARSPQVTIRVDEVTVTAEGDVSITVEPPSAATTAPASAPTAKAWSLPTWLGAPLARYTLYAAASAGAVLLLQLLKRRFGWEGKKMLTATGIVVAAFGLILSYVTQDRAYLSNPFNLGGGVALVYTLANLAYQVFVKR